MVSARSRQITDIAWKIITYLFPVVIITLYALTLTGSVSNSPGMSNIYLVRAGYFGICAGLPKNLVCTPSHGISVDSLMSTFNGSTVVAPEITGHTTLLSLALVIQNSIIPPLLIVGGVLFVGGLIGFYLWKGNLKIMGRGMGDQAADAKRLGQQRGLKIATLSLVWSSLAMALASTVSVAMTTAALQFNVSNLMTPKVSINVSPTLIALQWTIVALSVLFGSAITVMLCGRGPVGNDVESKLQTAFDPLPPS